jgi:hypothetical protein
MKNPHSKILTLALLAVFCASSQLCAAAGPAIYEPRFQSVSGMTALSGTFAVGPSGGLFASANGSTAAGTINLRVQPLYTQPWRWAALIYWGGTDAANTTTVSVTSAGGTFWSYIQLGITGGSLVLAVGANNDDLSTALPLGVPGYYWVGAASDGNQVCVYRIPQGHAGLINSGGFHTVSSAAETVLTYANNYVNGGHTPSPFAAMQTMTMSNSSATNGIMGVMFSVNSLAGGTDSRLLAPAICPVSITRPDGTVDTTGRVMIPDSYAGGAYDAIFSAHGNGSDEYSGFASGAQDNGVAFASLRAAGFAMMLLRGDVARTGVTSFQSYSTNYASGWGAPNSTAVRLQMITQVQALMPGMRNLHGIGQSMGALDLLSLQMDYPGLFKSLYCISGVANLSATYNAANGGADDSSYINVAYPIYYVCISSTSGTTSPGSDTTHWTPVTTPGGLLTGAYATASLGTNGGAWVSGTSYSANQVVFVNATALATLVDHDPNLRPDALASLPMAFSHGTSDSTIPLAQLQVFVATMTAAGNTPSLTTAAGGHLAAALYSGPTMTSFFQAHNPTGGSVLQINSARDLLKFDPMIASSSIFTHHKRAA